MSQSIVVTSILNLFNKHQLIKNHSVRLPNDISAFSTHSKDAIDGGAYIAYSGASTDGHRYIAELAQKKSLLFILENPEYQADCGNNSWIEVTSARAAWTLIASLAFEYPQTHLKLYAITGTNGKTSTAFITRSLLAAAGISSCLIGTLGIWIGDEFVAATHTTPDPPLFFEVLERARQKGITHVIMEASSHALHQNRLFSLKFDAAVWTSFSQDHLDYHRSMEEYWKAKTLLFDHHLSPSARLIFNSSLPFETGLETFLKEKDAWIYGLNAAKVAQRHKASCFIELDVIKRTFGGCELQLSMHTGSQRQGSVPYIAPFSLDNFTAACLLFEKITGKFPEKELWNNVQQVPGRMELANPGFLEQGQPGVYVDYAHTPDALEKAITTLKSSCPGSLWVVFGCGGNRDRSKRPIMGKIAEALADHVIVTSDNPRNEAPQSIIDEILHGMAAPEKVISLVNRDDAIKYATMNAEFNDMILIAGKGHEDYQIIGSQKLYFDDRKQAVLHLGTIARRKCTK